MIYVVMGPTGVGKTKLSIFLAKKTNAIIINADSMQVYKELNIGTAKIKADEKENIKHYLFDIVSVKDEFNAFMYQKLGRELLDKYKDKNVVIVGGTGLYIKALLYNYTFGDNVSKNEKLYDFKLIGLTRNRDDLYEIINNRVDKMLEDGLLEETKKVYQYKDTHALKTAIGYKELFPYIEGKISLEESVSLIKQNSRHYAKRQYTFFNNQFDCINWYDVSKMSISDIVNNVVKKCQ